ncbi:HAL/PAL/TAL family ammonia-lyase [Pontibacter russatus]|uniref:HAL/PAL/TAL family ammonia-lyase n=1 Tax=Pontibacter russatus TaxID=2694929 RepID=UPI0013798331|nr:aromatic amino acid ammonia-lyase [Pontibacter russatus]
MPDVHYISGKYLDLETIGQILRGQHTLALSEEAEQRIVQGHTYLQLKINAPERPIYSTGTQTQTYQPDQEQLQRNLLLAHACGVGMEVPQDMVKLMLLLKIQSLAHGHSGVQLKTVKRLIDFYNREVYPVVYQQGSAGAGDAVPLAHLCLPLAGLGEVSFQGYKLASEHVLEMFSWEPVTLNAGEGLALLSGTQFTATYGVLALLDAQRLSRQADMIGALSLDAFDGSLETFNALIHRLHPHKGQRETAAAVRQLLEGSELMQRQKRHGLDPYSFQGMPQVHGATKDAITFTAGLVETEINTVTGDPIVFQEEDTVLSGGISHGQPLELALDFLATALANLGGISERRSCQLVSGLRGLPEFLVAEPGINTGFLASQSTAAAIVSQNRQLCTPASTGSFNAREDYICMGANAATKLYQVVENVERVLAIELLHAAQALDFRRPLRSSPVLEKLVAAYREKVPFMATDRMLHHDVKASIAFLREYPF